MRSIALTIPTAASYLYQGQVGPGPLANLSHATAIILAFMCANLPTCTAPLPHCLGFLVGFRVMFALVP